MRLVSKAYLECFLRIMSSHHFVREGQEPALLIADAEADEQIMAMLEWSPLIMVAERALPKVASWGIRIDVVFVDSSAGRRDVETTDALLLNMDVGEVIPVSDNLPNAVATYLNGRSEQGLQVIIKNPRDHLDDWELDQRLMVTLLDPSVRWSRITSRHYEKWMPGNSLLYLAGDAMTVSGGELVDGVVHATGNGIITVISSQAFWVGEPLPGANGVSIGA